MIGPDPTRNRARHGSEKGWQGGPLRKEELKHPLPHQERLLCVRLRPPLLSRAARETITAQFDI